MKKQNKEQALKASLYPHESLWLGLNEEKLGRFYERYNEIELRFLPEEYEKNIKWHEFIHWLLSLNTSYKRGMIFYHLDNIGRPKQIQDFYYHGREYIFKMIEPFQEAFALHFQLSQPSMPKDLKNSILEKLTKGDKKFIGSLTAKLRLSLEKIENRYQHGEVPTPLRFQIGYCICKAILAIPFQNYFTPLFGPYRRLQVLYDLPQEEIPEWRDLPDIINLVEEVFNKNLLPFYKGEPLYSRKLETMMENIGFLSWTSNRFKEVKKEELRPYVFGILSELDLSFQPIIYHIESFNKFYDRSVRTCLVKEQNLDPMSFQNFIGEFKNVKEEIDNIRSNERKEILLYIFNECEKSLNNLIKEKAGIFKKCPKNCNSECLIKDTLIELIKNSGSNQYIAWPS